MDQKRGWGKPLLAKKWHYFIDGMSLCHMWIFFGEVEDDDEEWEVHDCKQCAKRLANEKNPPI